MRSYWRCLLRRTFFGLTDEYIQSIYEQIFYLKYLGGWSFYEAYNLPIGLREWFVSRLTEQLEKEKEAIENASNNGSSGNFQTLSSHNAPQMPQGFGK
jgi:hypothetical protein